MNVQQISNLLGNFNPDFNSSMNRNYQGYTTLGEGIRRLRDRNKEQQRYDEAQKLAAEEREKEKARYLEEQGRKNRAEELANRKAKEDAEFRQAEFKWRQDEAQANRDFALKQQNAQREKEFNTILSNANTLERTLASKDPSTWSEIDTQKISDLMEQANAYGATETVDKLNNLLSQVSGQIAINNEKKRKQQLAQQRWQNYQQGQTIKKNIEADAAAASKKAQDQAAIDAGF